MSRNTFIYDIRKWLWTQPNFTLINNISGFTKCTQDKNRFVLRREENIELYLTSCVCACTLICSFFASRWSRLETIACIYHFVIAWSMFRKRAHAKNSSWVFDQETYCGITCVRHLLNHIIFFSFQKHAKHAHLFSMGYTSIFTGFFSSCFQHNKF